MSVPISYLLFEIAGLILLLICAIFRIKKKDLTCWIVITELISILLYGMTLEILSISMGSYKYPPFALMVFGVPLIIGIGWSTIIFTAMWLTDSLKMTEWSKIFLDAMLAILIDLNMDAVAIRDIYDFGELSSGMWSWGIGLNEQWYGVPWFNFSGWWFIAFTMSFSIRLFRYIAKHVNYRWFRNFSSILAYPLSIGLLFVIGQIMLLDINLLVFVLQISISIIIILIFLRGNKFVISLKEDLPILLIPATFHIGFLSLLIINRYFLEALPILFMSIGVTTIHLVFILVITKLSRKLEKIQG